MTLTFKGFLEKYLKELSNGHTCSVNKCLKEIKEDNNYLLVEPLFLYAFMTLDKERFNKFLNKYDYFREVYDKYFSSYKTFEDVDFSALPYEFSKVKDAFLAEKGITKRDNELKLLMLKEINTLREKKRVTAYRIYTDLKLNHGNVNDFLKNGNTIKLSLNDVRRIWNYLETVA